ncbi:hypothetical protein [Neptunicella marina]|uniref:Uncharacterized protein n=1 Tax=Neptunicella marina TaxID=2125989 RepID=A0A8J6M122_9ALTE|nr:hypothetical protein [Neptunicella marina]MBC3767544.1 hypothetical protein [Neptunicella marina]
MFNKVKTLSAVFLIAVSGSQVAQAQEFDLNQVSGQLMQKATQVLEQQVQQQIDKAVVNATESLDTQSKQTLPESDVVIQTEEAPEIIAANIG